MESKCIIINPVEDISIIINPKIPNEIEIKKVRMSSAYIFKGCIIKRDNGMFYKTQSKKTYKTLIFNDVIIKKIIKIKDKIIYHIICGYVNQVGTVYEICKYFHIYKGTYGRRLFREYLYSCVLIYFPNYY